MAGIGFELRKILKEDSLLSILKVYGYSAVLSSGSWIISIISILFLGIINLKITNVYSPIVQFQVMVTYLVASSLIYSGFFQLSFTRYIADRLFEKDYYTILPNYLGVLILMIFFGVIIMIPITVYILPNCSNILKVFFVSSFIVLTCMWISNSLLLGLKEYKKITIYFIIGYLIIIIISLFSNRWGLEGYMASFLVGKSFIFFSMFSMILKSYKSDRLMELDFLTNKKHRIFFDIAFAGLFYNLGIWADKFVFWFNNETSQKVIGVLRASVLYDLPIFLAYLSIIPGTAVFFFRLEADFAEKYDTLFDSIRTDGTYEQIIRLKEEMNEVIRMAIKETIIVQGIFNTLIYMFSDKIFQFFNIPMTYSPLFVIDLIAVQLQLCLLVTISILFYMNKRKESLVVTVFFFILNMTLSQLSIKIGFNFYGYGFAVSGLISFILGLILLKRSIDDLEYETYCLIN